MVLKCKKFKAKVLYFEVVSYLFPDPLAGGWGLLAFWFWVGLIFLNLDMQIFVYTLVQV